ncbi:MAG: succinate--CoA ligase subunit alpha [Candidatus Methanomethylicaceae archaeon]
MSILAFRYTNVMIQGITGKAARHHTRNMLDYGTRIVAGVRPGAGGETVEGIPVYDSVEEACLRHKVDASVLFVPAAGVKAAALEALGNGIKLIVIHAEHVPIHDTMVILEEASARGATVIGPNTPGLISPPEKVKLGFVPSAYFKPGPIGVASRSGTLTYELVARLTHVGLGQSTVIGVGGDRIVGLRFARVLELFEEDPETSAILFIGEIGGSMEEEAAALISTRVVTKPVFAYLAGHTAPRGHRVGHAGAIVDGSSTTAESKVLVLKEAGVKVGTTISETVKIMAQALRGAYEG